jgi:hypothetical protein
MIAASDWRPMGRNTLQGFLTLSLAAIDTLLGAAP